MQYQQLRTKLIQFNQSVVRALKKVQGKPQRLKTVQKLTDKTLQIKQRQIENNQHILQMHRKQYALLQKRTQFINNNDKKNIEEQIIQIKCKIQKYKNKIKELKKKEKIMGNSIVNSDQIFQQMRKLQIQCQNGFKKKNILEKKIDSVEKGIIASLHKISSINEMYFKAEQFFTQQNRKNLNIQMKKKIQFDFKYKKQAFDVAKRKNHTQVQMKQQKYHQILKQFQSQIQRSKKTTGNISTVQMNIIQTKNTLAYLQETLKNLNLQIQATSRLKNQETSFYTQIQHNKKEKNSIKLFINENSKQSQLKKDEAKDKKEKISNVQKIQQRKYQRSQNQQKEQKKQEHYQQSQDYKSFFNNKNDKNEKSEKNTIQVQVQIQEQKKNVNQNKKEIKQNLQSKLIEEYDHKADLQKKSNNQFENVLNAKKEKENQLLSDSQEQLIKKNQGDTIQIKRNKIGILDNYQNRSMDQNKSKDKNKQTLDIEQRLTQKQKLSLDILEVNQKINNINYNIEKKKKSRFNFDDDIFNDL